MAAFTMRVERVRRTLLPELRNGILVGDLSAMVRFHEFPSLTYWAVRILGKVRHEMTYGNSLLQETLLETGAPLLSLPRFHTLDRLGDLTLRRLLSSAADARAKGRLRNAEATRRAAVIRPYLSRWRAFAVFFATARLETTLTPNRTNL